MPTAIFQSVAFVMESTPCSGLAITKRLFLVSFASTIVQLSKTTLELMYVAYSNKCSVFRTVWESLVAQHIVVDK